MTNPPNADPSAKPNWIKEVFMLRAMSGFRGTSVTRRSCWAGEILQVATIKIIKIKINTKRLIPASANKRSVTACNSNPKQMVKREPFASANYPPTLEPRKLQMPAKNRMPLISVIERGDVACKKGVI